MGKKRPTTPGAARSGFVGFNRFCATSMVPALAFFSHRKSGPTQTQSSWKNQFPAVPTDMLIGAQFEAKTAP